MTPDRQQRPKGHPTAKPRVDEYVASWERVNRAGAKFLKLDLEIALTFVSIARQTVDPARQERNQKAARRAYDTVMRLMERVKLSGEDTQKLVWGLEQLRSELKSLGEVF